MISHLHILALILICSFCERAALEIAGSCCLNIFSATAFLIEHPTCALVISAVFFCAYLLLRGRLTCLCAVLWLLYGMYESAISYQFLCPGRCNIRVDLLLFHPALLVVSIGALCEISVLALMGRGRRT
ncbi:MAG: hypothetical protein O9341_12980 [Paucibacter sp.]|nr:hypothetical protein [Roseateles sp.]